MVVEIRSNGKIGFSVIFDKDNMRLTDFEKDAIKKSFHKVFNEGKIYLFGSRVDDALKGGDIDLYLCPKESNGDMHKKKIRFLVELDLTIGEQKIDVIIARDKNRLIEKEALNNGIELV